MSTRTEATEGQAKIRQALEQARAALGFDAYCLHCDTVTGDHKPHAHSAKGTGSSDESMDAEAFQGVRDLVGRLDEALAILDASPPIVGELVAWRNPANDVALCLSEIERRGGDKGACSEPLYSHPPVRSKALTDEEIDRITDDLGLGSRGRCSFRAGLRYARDNGYLAQAPQSSPAPSVIEAGDAMLSRLQHSSPKCLSGEKCVCGLAEIYERWDAAKASRPSVTAPKHLNLEDEARVWWDERYGGLNPDTTSATHERKMLAAFASHVLSLSPAPTYAMSRDYDRLYALLKAGEQVLVWVTHKDTDYPAVAERMLGGCSVSSLGHTFFNAIACSTERTLFVTECTRLNLEWLSPAAQGVTVDQILEVVNDWRANMHLIEVPPNTPYSTGVQNVLRSRLSALLTK